MPPQSMFATEASGIRARIRIGLVPVSLPGDASRILSPIRACRDRERLATAMCRMVKH
jgi:hypothetical protein